MKCGAFAEIDPGICQICEESLDKNEGEQHFDVEGSPCGWAHSECVEARQIQEGS